MQAIGVRQAPDGKGAQGRQGVLAWLTPGGKKRRVAEVLFLEFWAGLDAILGTDAAGPIVWRIR